MLWAGSAASHVDLNPVGFTGSQARGVADGRQVGYGQGPGTGRASHALLWTGTADSYVDLHTFLGPGYVDSWAQAIDPAGNIVGWATDTAGYAHAVLWTPVPEPVTLGLLVLGSLGLVRRRGR